MRVGWVVHTPAGFRIYQSQQGRFFHDPATARSRENVVYKKIGKRNAATRRRDHYLAHWHHLDWSGPRQVRSSRQYDGPDAA